MGFKKILRKILPVKVLYAIRSAVYPQKIDQIEARLVSFFLTQHASLAAPDSSQKIAFKNAEFKVYSKHGTDGILLHIFSKIGVTNRTFLEIGIENGRECNTANLALNFGWNGLMIDSNEQWVESAKKYFRDKLHTKADAVKVAPLFVTAENIDSFIRTQGLQGEIDLFSIDIDGNDYWVWKALTVVRPRVVVAEYNATFGLRPITIPYNPKHHFKDVYKKNPLYFGASITALTKLAKEKGYILVACNSDGLDGIFVREDVAQGKFVAVSPEEAYYPYAHTLKTIGSVEKQFERIKDLPVIEV